MNGMPYFKLYTEACRDAKLRQLTDSQFRAWFQLLCYAAEQEVRGRIVQPLDLIAVETTEGDVDRLRDACDALVKFHIISCSPECHTPSHPLSHPPRVTACDMPVTERVTIVFLAFEKRQGLKPADTPERTRERKAKSRAAKRSVTTPSDVSHPVTPPVTACHTPSHLEKEEEEDKEKGNPPTPLSSSTLGNGATTKAVPGAAARRSGRDLESLLHAVDALTSNDVSRFVGQELEAKHEYPDNLVIPGWKWLEAAQLFEVPGRHDNKERSSFSYLRGIAENLTDDEAGKADRILNAIAKTHKLPGAARNGVARKPKTIDEDSRLYTRQPRRVAPET